MEPGLGLGMGLEVCLAVEVPPIGTDLLPAKPPPRQPPQGNSGGSGGGGGVGGAPPPPPSDPSSSSSSDEDSPGGRKSKRSREKASSERKKKRRRSRSGDRRRVKEADTVTLLTLPNVVGFRNWKLAVRSAVVAASGRGDEAFKWIMEVEKDNIKHEDLAESGKKFVNLDWKLKSALDKIQKGELGMAILQATEEEAKHGRALKGRQALLIVYRYYNIDEDLGVAYATVDLMNVTWKGDPKMEAFLNDWTMVLGGIKEPPPADLVETLFYRQMKKSTALREDVAHYERAEKG